MNMEEHNRDRGKQKFENRITCDSICDYLLFEQ